MTASPLESLAALDFAPCGAPITQASDILRSETRL